jgi:phenylacetate-CoA ligase
VDAGVSAAAPVLAGFDPGPEIRASVRGHRRYAPRLRRAARDLARFARMDAPARDGALAARLAALRRALWRSPFYLDVLLRLGLSPHDLRALDDLEHFPTLDRATLSGAFDSIPALLPFGHGRLFVERSSGSTGRPLAVLKEDYDSVHMWAVLRFFLRWREVRLPTRPRIALLCTLPHGVEYRTPLPALGGELVRVSLARPEPAARLRAFRPHVALTDPAGLHWLAGLADPPRPRLLLSSAMHLAPGLRRRVEAALGVPVVNYYSLAETGPVAFECAAAGGRFHVLLPDVWVESVDGEIVVTRLRESVLPLLRYRTGDRGDVHPDRCACGYGGLSITGLAGRRACAFVTPEGREVDAWRLAWAFQHHPLDGFRLTQVGKDAFRLDLAAAERPGAEVLGRLRASLVALGWEAPRVDLRRVPREALAGNKPEPFVRRPAFPSRPTRVTRGSP